MRCKIERYGGSMLIILCLFISFANSFIQETNVQEFCSGNSFIRNIEPGELFTLVFKSEQDSLSVSKWYRKTKQKCRQEIKTSDPSAHFAVAISDMNIQSCNDNCRCNYFEIADSGHRKRFCGVKAKDYFPSKSDKLSVEFHHGSTMQFDVSITFSVERNVYIITGTPKDSSESTNFVETPYFPIPYPPNYRAEYILQSDDPNSYVLLVFLDFQISHYSFIEVTGYNGTHVTRFYGDTFRPPAIVSQSNQLILNFQSNDQPGMPGFRAISSFIKSADSLVVPYTDCAESKDGKGGYIKIKTHQKFSLYDCVWHIVPSSPFSKSNLSIVTQMRNISHKSFLVFRRGSNSKADIIKEINCKVQDCNFLNIENIIPVSDYIYIQFHGFLDEYSSLSITYSAFHMENCSEKEFKCKDGRCILVDFKCDGISHCLDDSDEEFCPSSTTENKISSVHNIQRVSFHSEDTYSYFILFGSLGVVCVLLVILVTAYNHWCKKPVITTPLRSPGELTDVQPTLYPVNSRNCDNPPSYDDFVKSSNFYPPLLYTRASQFIPKSPCAQCTTSFCSGARTRHHSADTFSQRHSDTSSGDIFLNISGGASRVSEQSSNSNTCNVEIIQDTMSFKTSKNTVKRSYSLDSKLNDLVNHDTCHILLSIVHPSNSQGYHIPQVQWYTLPPNFKYNTFKNCDMSKVNEPSLLNIDSNVNLSKDRRFTWSFVPHSSNSELITVVKTRCLSEPYRKISIQCSLY